MIVTRFAPSPTGFLHIGNARTALFSYLYARHNNGKFLLRVEDTDRARSTPEAVDALFNGLKWLGINWDGDAVFQFARSARHAEVAHELVKMGKAYFCYTTQAEIDEARANAEKEGAIYKYGGKWRDIDPTLAPKDVKPVIRLKADLSGETVIKDMVQGDVVIQNTQLDDMVLLRSDGTPTYMLAVVVDDHDMGVTDIIRGDDHLVNAARQMQIYHAMSWDIPRFAHIPLIHGEDGAKLSKRHGALPVEGYRDLGYLPITMRNYLLRLGWGHGNEEIISDENAIKWFDIKGIGRSPSRLDFKKLQNLNNHYIKNSDADELLNQIMPWLQLKYSNLSDESITHIKHGIKSLKQKAKTLIELADSCHLYASEFYPEYTDESKNVLSNKKELAIEILDELKSIDHSAFTGLFTHFKDFASKKALKINDIAEVMRYVYTGSNVGPSMFEFMEIIGQDKAVKRFENGMKILEA